MKNNIRLKDYLDPKLVEFLRFTNIIFSND